MKEELDYRLVQHLHSLSLWVSLSKQLNKETKSSQWTWGPSQASFRPPCHWCTAASSASRPPPRPTEERTSSWRRPHVEPGRLEILTGSWASLERTAPQESWGRICCWTRSPTDPVLHSLQTSSPGYTPPSRWMTSSGRLDRPAVSQLSSSEGWRRIYDRFLWSEDHRVFASLHRHQKNRSLQNFHRRDPDTEDQNRWEHLQPQEDFK